jgi:hypothetical protein
MGYFYFDESKHPHQGSFVLGALVFHDEDPTTAIATSIEEAGLVPFKDEFKSSANMVKRPEQARLRDKLFKIGGRMALVVCPYSSLNKLGTEGLGALSRLVAGRVPPESQKHHMFFDREIFGSEARGRAEAQALGLNELVVGHFEQDSVAVLGIQLADLAAHTCSQMLLEELGLKQKMVRIGENSGYDPDTPTTLGFKLWGQTRYNWLTGPSPMIPAEGPLGPEHLTLPVLGYGLFISPDCPADLRLAAERRFGSVYMGCIH